MSPSIRATRKYSTLPGSNPPHGNRTTAVKTGRAYLDLTSSGDIASFLTPKTPRRFTSLHLAGAFGMARWTEKIVHWTMLPPSFNPDDRTRVNKPPGEKEIYGSYGRCLVVDTGGM